MNIGYGNNSGSLDHRARKTFSSQVTTNNFLIHVPWERKLANHALQEYPCTTPFSDERGLGQIDKHPYIIVCIPANFF